MKTNRIQFLFTFLFMVIVSVGLQAQSDYKVSYKFDIQSEDAMAAAMMGDASMILMFKGDKARVVMDMGVMSTTVITHDKSQKGVMLMDMSMMGAKMGVEIAPENYSELQAQTDIKPEIRETGKTKKILEYNCKQAFVKTQGVEIEIWYTPEIVPTNTATQYTYEGIKGLPLEIHSNEQGVQMVITAEEVLTDPIAIAEFELKIPEGYEKMSWAQMQQMGGLGGN